MTPDFDWRDCILAHDSNAVFLRGQTARIYQDCETPIASVAGALLAAFLAGFAGQFFWHSWLLAICAVGVGIWVGILNFRQRARAIARRSQARLIQGEILTVESDMAEVEGTILIYRFVSAESQIQIARSYLSAKPTRFSAGDKLAVLCSVEGAHTIL